MLSRSQSFLRLLPYLGGLRLQATAGAPASFKSRKQTRKAEDRSPRSTNTSHSFSVPPSLVSLVSTVYCHGMKYSRASAPVEPEKLKPVLHEKIERMNGEQLVLLDRVLLQLEAEQAAERLGEAFDADHAQGKLQRVAELVRQYRAEHRYA